MMTVSLRRLVIALLLGAPLLARAESPPAYLLEARGCAVLLSGSVGSAFADPQVAGMWQAINNKIADYLHDYLQQAHVKLPRLQVKAEEAPALAQLVPATLARHRCNRVLEIDNDVGEDAAGPYFAFIVSLVRMAPASEQTDAAFFKTTARSEYNKRYRFARTKEVFDTFYVGRFAHEVYEDLNRSGALEPMR